MTNIKSKKELKNLLSNGKIEEVIEELKKHSDEHIFNALTLLSIEFRENKEHELLNTRPQQDIRIANNKLAKSLIDIIDGKIDAPFRRNDNNLEEDNDFNFNLRLSKKAIIILVITVVMILIIYLIFVFYILESSEKDPTIILG